MKLTQMTATLLLLLGAVQLQAQSAADVIRGKLQQARPDFTIESVQPSVVEGIFEVQISGGPVVYSTADGDHFFLGDLFSVAPTGLVNLAEQRRDGDRKVLMAGVKDEDMIVFSPAGEVRERIVVFTDVDCFYCQKLHQEVPAMNAKGIEVAYVAYPRSGIGGDSYRKIASAWCADNPQVALTKLKNRENIAENVCSKNPVADQYMLGQKAGVRGTPALVLSSGSMIPGYVSADELAQRLGIN